MLRRRHASNAGFPAVARRLLDEVSSTGSAGSDRRRFRRRNRHGIRSFGAMSGVTASGFPCCYFANGAENHQAGCDPAQCMILVDAGPPLADSGDPVVPSLPERLRVRACVSESPRRSRRRADLLSPSTVACLVRRLGALVEADHAPPRQQSNVRAPRPGRRPAGRVREAETMHAAHEGAWPPHVSGTTTHVGLSVGSPVPPSIGNPPDCPKLTQSSPQTAMVTACDAARSGHRSAGPGALRAGCDTGATRRAPAPSHDWQLVWYFGFHAAPAGPHPLEPHGPRLPQLQRPTPALSM